MKQISVTELKKKMDSGDIQLIDVRESFEFAMMRIPGAKHIPLRRVAASIDEIDMKRPVYFVCRSGSRSSSAAQILAKNARAGVINVTGGVVEWNRQGFPTEKTERAPWDIHRRIRFIAGFVIIAAAVLAATVNPTFGWIAVLMAFGLIFAGIKR